MSEYTLANGTTITDTDIDELCKAFESESWTGHLERIHHGSAAASDEQLVGDPPQKDTSVPSEKRSVLSYEGIA